MSGLPTFTINASLQQLALVCQALFTDSLPKSCVGMNSIGTTLKLGRQKPKHVCIVYPPKAPPWLPMLPVQRWILPRYSSLFHQTFSQRERTRTRHINPLSGPCALVVWIHVESTPHIFGDICRLFWRECPFNLDPSLRQKPFYLLIFGHFD